MMSELTIGDATFKISDLDVEDVREIFNARANDIRRSDILDFLEIGGPAREAISDGDDLSDWVPESQADERAGVQHIGDLQQAIDTARRARPGDQRCLPDILHYLTRAIPALDPLVALLERETGRKLTP